MSGVVAFPGAFRVNPDDATTPRDVVFASQPDADAAIGLLTRGLTFLATSEQLDEPMKDGA